MISFIQLPVPQLVPQELTGNLPLAAGSMILHARSANGAEVPASIMAQHPLNRLGDEALVRFVLDQKPRTFGFTCSVWNIERTLYIAQELKSRQPDISIAFGGPEVTEDSFFISDRSAPFDYAVEGEGEPVMARLLAGAAPRDIKGLLLPGGTRTSGSIEPAAVTSLDLIHDPFLAGLATPESDGVIYAELYRGCRYGCSFCRYHQGRMRQEPAIRTNEKIAELFSWARRQGVGEIYLLDPSLEQRPDFENFLDFIASINKPVLDLFCELRVDAVDERLALKLAAAGVRLVETGLQSLSPEALRAVGRNPDTRKFQAGITALQKANIAVRTDVMVGLPFDTPLGFNKTLSFLLDNDLQMRTQVFRTQVLPGTALRAEAQQKQIVFEDLPPYFILSTPTWPEEEMEKALEFAEMKLDITLSPEERPVLVSSSWREQGYVKKFIDRTDAAFLIALDLDTEQGRTHADREAFDDVAATITVWLAAEKPHDHRERCAEIIDRLLSANPFAALTTIFDAPAGSPLDIVDDSLQSLDIHPFSNYGLRMYGNTAASVPGRRVMWILDAQQRKTVNQKWLDSMRESCEAIWRVEIGDLIASIDSLAAIHVPEYDYLLLDIHNAPPQSHWPLLFDRIAASAADPQQILVPGLAMHWAWLRHLEKK